MNTNVKKYIDNRLERPYDKLTPLQKKAYNILVNQEGMLRTTEEKIAREKAWEKLPLKAEES